MKSYQTVLGMNRRNKIIDEVNSPESQQKTDFKQRAKDVLTEAGVNVVPTLRVLHDRACIRRFNCGDLPDAWVVKPNAGAQGRGILLAFNRVDDTTWAKAGGENLSANDLIEHLNLVCAGEYSSGALQKDKALFEPLLIAHPALNKLSPEGLPDIRVLCWQYEPVMAMLRLPTAKSDGKANLHRGAVGVSVGIESGITNRAQIKYRDVSEHPDTGESVIGVEIPYWQEILAMSREASAALALGYAGLDITIDEERGPTIIEGNAHPGLEIQNVNNRGLMPLLKNS